LFQEDSDFRVVCNGVNFHVHKTLLKAGSSYFRAVCNAGSAESSEASVNLSDHLPHCVARMLLFIYTGGYEDHDTDAIRSIFDLQTSDVRKDTTSLSKLATALLHTSVFRCADKFDIEPLRVLASTSFPKELFTTISREEPPAILKAIGEATRPGDLHHFVVLNKRIHDICP
jgi:speckle-type POZ protein